MSPKKKKVIGHSLAQQKSGDMGERVTGFVGDVGVEHSVSVGGSFVPSLVPWESQKCDASRKRAYLDDGQRPMDVSKKPCNDEGYSVVHAQGLLNNADVRLRHNDVQESKGFLQECVQPYVGVSDVGIGQVVWDFATGSVLHRQVSSKAVTCGHLTNDNRSTDVVHTHKDGCRSSGVQFSRPASQGFYTGFSRSHSDQVFVQRPNINSLNHQPPSNTVEVPQQTDIQRNDVRTVRTRKRHNVTRENGDSNVGAAIQRTFHDCNKSPSTFQSVHESASHGAGGIHPIQAAHIARRKRVRFNGNGDDRDAGEPVQCGQAQHGTCSAFAQLSGQPTLRETQDMPSANMASVRTRRRNRANRNGIGPGVVAQPQPGGSHNHRACPPVEYIPFGPCTCVCSHCDAKFWYEERLSASTRRTGPLYHHCCMGGRVQIFVPAEYPTYVQKLFSDQHFIDNIRAYNQMFAMTSLGATIDETVNVGRGPYVFKVGWFDSW